MSYGLMRSSWHIQELLPKIINERLNLLDRILNEAVVHREKTFSNTKDVRSVLGVKKSTSNF